MKNLLKHLPLVALASLSLAGGSVFAQSTTLTLNGTFSPSTCVLKFYDSAAAAAALTNSLTAAALKLPDANLTDFTASSAPFIVTTNPSPTLYIKALTAGNAASCDTVGTNKKFNVIISSTNLDVNGMPTNTIASASGGATGVSIAMVPVSNGDSATGAKAKVDLTNTGTAANNHGLADVATATGTYSFQAKWFKASAAGTAATSGQVSIGYTVQAVYN